MRALFPEDGPEYVEAMRSAKQEFQDWEAGKRRERKGTKEKYKAQRLAKLHAMEMLSRGEL